MNSLPARQRTRIDVDQYHKMAAAGIFASDARIELIDGELLDMPPIGSRHAFGVNGLNRLLAKAGVHDRAVISIQNSLIVSRYNEPQPDVLLLAPRADGYRDTAPRTADVLLLIEVADSSYGFDGERKLALYAQFGIREYWILNIEDQRLETYRDPEHTTYATRRDFRPGELAAPAALPDIELAWFEAL